MPAKRKAAGKAGKGNAQKTKRGARRRQPAATYLQPYRSLPVELLEKIFQNIEDPVTGTTFSLVDKLFHRIFHAFRSQVFPETTFPLKLPFIFRFDDMAKSQISLRATLHSWFPADFFFDISRGKYVHRDYAQDVLKEIIGAAEKSREERKQAIYDRREAKEIRQEERAERNAAKAQGRKDVLEGWRQAMYASMGDSDEILDESDEPTDYYSSDSASESDLDMDLDSDVDQICKKPDWDAMGIPEPSLEEWIRMSKKPYTPELPKKDKAKVRTRRLKAA